MSLSPNQGCKHKLALLIFSYEKNLSPGKPSLEEVAACLVGQAKPRASSTAGGRGQRNSTAAGKPRPSPGCNVLPPISFPLDIPSRNTSISPGQRDREVPPGRQPGGGPASCYRAAPRPELIPSPTEATGSTRPRKLGGGGHWPPPLPEEALPAQRNSPGHKVAPAWSTTLHQ